MQCVPFIASFPSCHLGDYIRGEDGADGGKGFPWNGMECFPLDLYDLIMGRNVVICF